MKKSYVYTDTYTGLDWHDAHYEIHPILENNRLEISNIREAIINDVCRSYPLADREKVAAAYDWKGNYHAPVSFHVSGVDCEREELSPDKCFIGYDRDGQFVANFESQFTHKTRYCVKEIDDKNVIFIPVCVYIFGLRDGGETERFYHEPFLAYEDAVEYMKHHEKASKLDANKDCPAYQQDYSYVMAFDKNKIVETEWYKRNMKAIETMAATEKDITSGSFRIRVDNHLEELEKIAEAEQER